MPFKTYLHIKLIISGCTFDLQLLKSQCKHFVNLMIGLALKLIAPLMLTFSVNAQITTPSPTNPLNSAPAYLGTYSPNQVAVPYSSNNSETQSSAFTPSLATPFIALQNATLDTEPKNGVPVKLAKLVNEKQWAEALKEVDQNIKKAPKNVQLLFVRSKILIELGQLENARIALVDLTDRFPELPEPYNNLAVLYASVGKLDLAKENLELCLRLSPNYAIALLNLADVYTKIAASYYSQAFQKNKKLKAADQKRKLADAITQN